MEVQLTRKAIRDDVAARIVAAATVAADRVYGFRTVPVPDDKLPAVLVYCSSGNGKTSRGSPIVRWSVDLAVECVTTGASDEAMGDAVDDFAEAVETALMLDDEWIGQFEAVPTLTYDVGTSIDGNRRLACVKLVFSLQFSRVYTASIEDASDLSTVELEVDSIDPVGEYAPTATHTLEAP